MFGLPLQAAFLMQYYGDVNKYYCGQKHIRGKPLCSQHYREASRKEKMKPLTTD